MIDAHTHLNSPILFDKWNQHISEFEKIGGKILINTGADKEHNDNGLEISKNYTGNIIVKCTIGYHPFEIVSENISENNLEKNIKDLEILYLDNEKHIVAIGETGIDSHYKGNLNLELQKKLFEQHCILAKKLNLPIMIHSRDAFDETMDVLKKYKDLKIYFHCWGYGRAEIQKIKNFGFKNFWIGFCGNITYPKAQNIRDSLLKCDLGDILIETDAPYLSPQKLRGTTNYPKNIQYIYEFIAKEKNMNIDNLIPKIRQNLSDLYDLKIDKSNP